MGSGRQRQDHKSTLCQLFCLLRNSNFKFKRKKEKRKKFLTLQGLDLGSHDYCSRALPRRQQCLLLSSLKECFNKHNMKTATVLIYVVE